MNAFRVRLESEQDAVPQGGKQASFDVGERDCGAASEQRTRFSPEHDCLSRPSARAVANEAASSFITLFAIGMSGEDQLGDEPQQVRATKNLADESLQLAQVFSTELDLDFGIRAARRRLEDLRHRVDRWRLDVESEQEPIELRFRERERAFQFDRILRGHHVERVGKPVRRSRDGHGVFLHRLEQSRLRLGRRAVDLVSEHEPAEEGARLKAEDPPPSLVVDHLRARCIARHEIGRELDAREFEPQPSTQRPHQHCLAEPWQTLEQHVTPGQDRSQEIVDECLLPDHLPSQLLPQGIDPGHQSRRPLLHCMRRHQGSSHLAQGNQASRGTLRRAQDDDGPSRGVCPTDPVMSATLRGMEQA